VSTGGFIHERHELVGESRHGAADANAADVGAAADSSHPAAFGNVAVHDRPPASQLHNALWGSVHFGEIALLVVTGSIEPSWTVLPNNQVGRSWSSSGIMGASPATW